MPTIDFESLTKPVSAEEPCGPDLELGGDLDYMNFIAGAEGLLPRSYFGKDQAGNEGRPFDRNSINFDAQFAAAQPFLEKTRDLRLLGILAKFSILNRDLTGFIACIRAISALLSDHWDEVHPRAEDGDFGFRMVAIESIDSLPTIVMPLQFLPLVEHKRFGSISYRGYLIAKGQLAPSEGEEPTTLPNLEKALTEVELSDLVEKRRQITELQAALTRIRQIWQEKCSSGQSISLDRLPESAAQIFAMLNATIVQRDPAASLEPASERSAGRRRHRSRRFTAKCGFIRPSGILCAGRRCACSGGQLFQPARAFQPRSVAGAASQPASRKVISGSDADSRSFPRGKRGDQYRERSFF